MLMPVVEEVPLGYVFNPTDEQLLYYLRTKVGGLQTLASPPKLEPIQEKELYGDRAPSEIFPISASDHDFFCYTLIKNKFGNGTRDRKDRIVSGKGTWKGTQGPKKIHHPQHKSLVIGYRRVLNFIPPPAAAAAASTSNKKYNRNSWIMHEYRLASYPPSDNHAQFWVLCRIKYTAATAGKKADVRSKKRCRTEDQLYDDQPLHLPTMSTDQDSLPLHSCLSNSVTPASSPADCSNQPSPTSHYCFDPHSATEDTQHSMLQQALPPTMSNATTTTATLDQAQGSMQHYPADLRLSEQEWDDICRQSDSVPQHDQLPLTTWNILPPTSDHGFHSPPLLSGHDRQPSSSHYEPQDDQFPSTTWNILPPTSDQGFHSLPLLSGHDRQPSSPHYEPQDDQFPSTTWNILPPTSDQGFHSPPLLSGKDLWDAFDTIHDCQPSSSHSEPQSYSDMLPEINSISCLMDDDDSGFYDFCNYIELPRDIEIGLVLD